MGLQSGQGLRIGFWHRHEFSPALPADPRPQAFLNSIRQFVLSLAPAERAAIMLHLNIVDRHSDPLARIEEARVVRPSLAWTDRIAHFADKDIREPSFSGLNAQQLLQLCERVALHLTLWINNLPRVDQAIIEVGDRGGQDTVVISRIHLEASMLIGGQKRSQKLRPQIELWRTEIYDVAFSYNWTHPSHVIDAVALLWESIHTALQSSLSTRTKKPLYVLAGQLQGLLSYAALYLDKVGDARRFAHATLDLAQQGGSANLVAWAYGTLSMLLRFQDRPMAALQYAQLGLETTATQGELRSRLFCAAAESAAFLGHNKAAIEFLAQGEVSHSVEPTRESFDLPGIFRFPAVKVYYYSGSTLVELEGVRRTTIEAAKKSEMAAKQFATDGGDRSPSDHLVALLHLARARLKLREIDGALEALATVVAAPRSIRTSWHRKFLRTTSEHVAQFAGKNSLLYRQIEDISFEFGR